MADRVLAHKLRCAVGKVWLRISSLRLDADNHAGRVDRCLCRPRVLRHRRPRACAAGDADQHAHRVALRAQDRGDPAGDPRQADSGCARGGACNEGRLRRASRSLRFYDDTAGDTIEVSVSVHPADRFVVVTRLTRERADRSVAAPGGAPATRAVRGHGPIRAEPDAARLARLAFGERPPEAARACTRGNRDARPRTARRVVSRRDAGAVRACIAACGARDGRGAPSDLSEKKKAAGSSRSLRPLQEEKPEPCSWRSWFVPKGRPRGANCAPRGQRARFSASVGPFQPILTGT